jgi:hypothetical protein
VKVRSVEGSRQARPPRRKVSTTPPRYRIFRAHCHDGSMPRIRHLSRWYWAFLIVVLTFTGLAVANQLLGWEQGWIIAALPIVGIATSIYTFRLLWKQSDHPAFHRDRSGSDESTPDR